MQLELEKDADKLQFFEEYQLSKKPMQIDVVVVKKDGRGKIQKNIGHIFRKHNIVQYKSPDDYLSVNDFYKTYGYACFYQADTAREMEIDPAEITITFICNRYPYKLLRFLKANWGISARKYDKGIYYLVGDNFPIQLILTHQLSPNMNFWLQSLRKDLRGDKEIREMARRCEKHRSSPLHQAVIEAAIRANWKESEVEVEMCDALRELFAKELKEKEIVGRAESVLDLLSDLGEIPAALKEKVLSQKNVDILRHWLKLAARAESLGEFQQSM